MALPPVRFVVAHALAAAMAATPSAPVMPVMVAKPPPERGIWQVQTPPAAGWAQVMPEPPVVVTGVVPSMMTAAWAPTYQPPASKAKARAFNRSAWPRPAPVAPILSLLANSEATTNWPSSLL